MHRNQMRETRFEPKYEESRASPFRQQYDRPRDISPQRFSYDRTLDPRANPHSEVYDPRFNPASPLPDYHKFPQPLYEHGNERENTDRYEQKKFDYRYDDRFHKVPEDRRRPPAADERRHYADDERRHHAHDQHWQPAFAPPMQYRQGDDTPRVGYDGVQAAGRANTYSTRITDLLTSIKDPEVKDDRVSKLMEANKGYLVMVRVLQNDLGEVINAIQGSVSTLQAHDGYCIGFSETGLLHIVTPSHQMVAKHQWGKSEFAIVLFWFKDYIQARSWFQTGSLRFKQPDFPNSNSYACIAVPLTYGNHRDPMAFGPGNDEMTLLWSEYPRIYERYTEDFLHNYSDRVKDIIKRYGGNPYVSISQFTTEQPKELNKYGSPGYARLEPSREDKARVGRSWKNPWVDDKSYITVSIFPSMQHVAAFYQDKEYEDLRYKLSQYSDPVMVAIKLLKVRGTTRW
ncbi:uncharacterized protein LOC123550637 isoform X2 [Mercenaria mercenaria]|uniref:uncharacterized protein LOC123550637 isoform X2 n=1 Tax=Mercenaria mercenaria TaxID=6596 RepID=UPI00234F3B8E|nr:uncharacterized protein LOC123550637 isoform X2 [Mercenaria mercenaria]